MVTTETALEQLYVRRIGAGSARKKRSDTRFAIVMSAAARIGDAAGPTDEKVLDIGAPGSSNDIVPS